MWNPSGARLSPGGRWFIKSSTDNQTATRLSRLNAAVPPNGSVVVRYGPGSRNPLFAKAERWFPATRSLKE
jgi:hypothetical protein